MWFKTRIVLTWYFVQKKKDLSQEQHFAVYEQQSQHRNKQKKPSPSVFEKVFRALKIL